MSRAILTSPETCAFEKLRPSDPEWDEFVSSNPHHLFQKSVWGLALEHGYQTQVSYYALRQGGRIVLGLPGMILNFSGLKVFYASTPYGGFVGDPGFIPDFLQRLSRSLKREDVALIRITQNADQENWPDFHPEKILKGYQHIIEFEGRTSRQISEEFDKSALRNVRRAEREGLTVRAIHGSEEIAIYYEMYGLAMKRLGALRPHTRRLYEAVYEHLIRQNLGTILFAEHQQKIVAGILLLFDRGTVYFFGSAFHPDANSLRPNDFLMGQAIQLAQEKGCAAFDFMTTSASQIGLVQYKEKWGAVSKPFFVYEKCLSGWKSGLWNLLWKAANTSAGSFLIDSFRKE